MSDITYCFHGMDLRTLTDHIGDPWFMAKDVCNILGLGNTTEALRSLDEDEKSNFRITEVGQNGGRAPIIVSEAGLYKLIMRSRKPIAKDFQRWLTHEVLPSIRKHGAYMSEQTLEKALSSPDFLIQLANQLKAEQTKRLEAERKAQAAEQRAQQLAAKATAFDEYTDSKLTYSVGEAAKLLANRGVDFGQKGLFERLRDLGWIYRDNGHWTARQDRINAGHLIMRDYATRGTRADGSRFAFNPQVRITRKGLILLDQRLCEDALFRKEI